MENLKAFVAENLTAAWSRYWPWGAVFVAGFLAHWIIF